MRASRPKRGRGGQYSGYQKHDSGRTTYSSMAEGNNQSLSSTITRTGSITAAYAADNQLTGVSGAITSAAQVSGSAVAHVVGDAIGVCSLSSLKVVAVTDLDEDRTESFTLNQSGMLPKT